MQPPTVAPAAPAPASAPQAPSAVALPDGGLLPLEGLPQTAQEVQGLRARREVLRDQLDRATNRRSQLVSQLDRGGSNEARSGVRDRLDLLDGRILEIERDQALTERLLSNASPAVLAQTRANDTAPGTLDEETAVTIAGAAFGVGILATLVVGRLRRRLARRRPGAATDTASIAADPRFDRLAQAVDAMAEEVERIGEGQRFVTRLLADQRDRVPAALESERR